MNEINFLPSTYQSKASRRRSMVRQVVLMSMITLALMGWAIIQHHQIDTKRHQAETLEEEVQATRLQATQAGKLRSRFVELKRLDDIRRELSQPISHTDVLHVLSEILPESVAITNLEMHLDLPEPRRHGESEEIANLHRSKPLLRIEITAVAPNDAEVTTSVAAVTESPLFEGTTLSYTRQIAFGDLEGREFELFATVDLSHRYIDTSVEEVAHVD